MSIIPTITGFGVVTPLGTGADATWDALLDGRFIADHARCPLDTKSSGRIHALALAAAEEAIEDARWTNRAALVIGTSKGGIAEAFEPSGIASVAARIRERLRLLDGPAITMSAACASGLHALIRGAMMIQSGEAERVLVVAAEASVHPLFIGSFKRLGVLPREGVGCRPFDEDRDGFLMSEAAAAVCIEPAERGLAGRSRIVIDRYALAGDASHMTATDPAGETLRWLVRQVVQDRPIDLVHAHATGTRLHDPVELSAIEQICAPPLPIVYSHKGALGHSLGASGLVSVVLNCLMHERGVVPPNVQTRRPLPTRLRLSRDAISGPIRRSLCIAAGFGGPMAAVHLVGP